MAWRIPVARPDIGEAEIASVHAVAASGWITQGAKVRELEAAFAQLCGTGHAVATTSGTTALHVVLGALGVGPGDEVITTPLSCIASANPILFTGARPVFGDVDRETYNLEVGGIEKCITSRTKAILPVHLFGHPLDLDPILEMGRAHGLPVIEDACQATGARYKGRAVGGWGTVGCFSLYANKIITSGEGGMIVTGDATLAERMRAIRNFGQIPGEHFLHAFLGGNAKMTDLQAAVGCAQAGKLEGYITRRRANVAALNSALEGLERMIERLPGERPYARSVYFGYHLLFREPRVCARTEAALHEAGIETRPFFSLIPDQAPYRDMGYRGADTPVAADLITRGLYLSNSPDLTDEDRELIVDTLRGVARAEGLG
ncbi:MAG TPA: DegT/DnrJ/EryC1/StrS family aminotransferase [Methylomirabilota bacterium]|jgi:perosamine synthetase|nr:DegT/DnrJ/EryC1/StrS family aminotransferase [Methylomirabilota bacterium]